MKLVEVEAVEDRSRAEGGYAVILLRDVGATAGMGRFRLRSVEADDGGAMGLAAEDLAPLAVELRGDGIALTIGPEITERPSLIPGGVVEITLPDAGLRGELLWPAVTPQARPRRRNIMVRRAAGDPLPQPIGAASQRNLASAAAGLAESPVPEPVAPSAERSSSRRPDRVTSPEPTAVEPLQQVTAGATVLAREDAVSVQAGADDAAPMMLRAEFIAPSGEAGEQVVVAAPPVDPSREAEDRGEKEASPVEGRGTRAAGATIAPAVVETAVDPKPSEQKVLEGKSEPSRSTSRGRAMTAGSAAALAVAVLIGGQIIAMRALDLKVERRSQTVGSTAVLAEPARPPVPVMVPVGGPNVSPAVAPDGRNEAKPVAQPGGPGLFEIFAVGPRSPRGIAGEGVSPAKALQEAHRLLHGTEAERDPEEAIYWLKHYLAGTAGGEHARIALTQLGSAYAQPIRGDRDFARARIVWELAAAFGDPVAMCFLGAVHEHGLGVPPFKEVAKAWYDRAVDAGRSCASAGGAGAESNR